MNNKVKFLRGTAAEYADAVKDDDTFYYTTDDEKFYVGSKEITGGGITVDSALSNTSTNPVQNKVIKAAIDEKADKTVATTSADGLMSASDKGKLDAFEITATGGKLHDKDIATTDLIPSSLPANGGNADYAADADKLDGLHANDFIKVNRSDAYDCNTLYDAGLYLCNGSATNTPNNLVYGTLLVMPYRKPYGNGIPDYCAQIFIPNGDADDTSLWYRTSLQNSWNEWKRSCDGGNADTVDGLHADDFVNATDKGQIQIPSNVDVPAWIYANGKRYKIYMTNGANIGMTNIPNDTTDYVWYWYDGLNILAREWATGRYYICDMINSGFSGWKDIYTSGFKPYVTGEEGCGYIVTASVKDYQIFNFTPSAVICQIADGSAFFATIIQNGFRVSLFPNASEKILKYIAFK